MARFKFYCLHCNQKIAAQDEWRGMQSECPHCGSTIEIPAMPVLELSPPKLKVKEPLESDEKYCPKCGEKIKKEAIFCRWCKQKFQDVSPAVPQHPQLCGEKIIQPILQNPCSLKPSVPGNICDDSNEGWFFSINAHQTGPMSVSEIQSMLKNGIIGDGVVLWRQGMAKWIPIRELPQFAPYLHNSPPITGVAVDNTYLWILAFVPVLAVIWNAIFGDKLMWLSWILFTGINISLCIWDGRLVEQCGHKKTSPWWVVLVPVYMALRAKTTQSGWWCLVFWGTGWFIVNLCIKIYDMIRS